MLLWFPNFFEILTLNFVVFLQTLSETILTICISYNLSISFWQTMWTAVILFAFDVNNKRLDFSMHDKKRKTVISNPNNNFGN